MAEKLVIDLESGAVTTKPLTKNEQKQKDADEAETRQRDQKAQEHAERREEAQARLKERAKQDPAVADLARLMGIDLES